MFNPLLHDSKTDPEFTKFALQLPRVELGNVFHATEYWRKRGPMYLTLNGAPYGVFIPTGSGYAWNATISHVRRPVSELISLGYEAFYTGPPDKCYTSDVWHLRRPVETVGDYYKVYRFREMYGCESDVEYNILSKYDYAYAIAFKYTVQNGFNGEKSE